MAALCATQDVLREQNAPANCEARGAQLRAGLEQIQSRHAWIGDVRGMGLMQALEIVKDPTSKAPDIERTSKLLEATRDEGVLVGQGGLHGTCIRLGPSMLISEEDIAEGVQKFAAACDRVG